MINQDENKVEVENNQEVIEEKKGEVVEVVEEVTEEDNQGIEDDIQNTNETIENQLTPFFVSNNEPLSGNFAVIRETAQALADMTNIANIICKSKLSPLKTPADIVLAIITGNQYGFPFMVSIANIYPINGKPSMGTHLIRGLIIKNKIIFRKVYNYEPVYEYAKAKKEDGKIVLVKVTKPVNGQPKEVPVLIGRFTKQEAPEETHIRGEIVDYITKYTFTRKIKDVDNSWTMLEVESEYKMSEARNAGLLDKDNWINHPARMLDARAFNIGAKEIAADILLGMYSISELADEANIKYNIDSSLQETIAN